MTGILVNGVRPGDMYSRLLEEVARQPVSPPDAPLSPPVITPHAGFSIEHQEDKGLFVVHNVVVEAGKLQGNWTAGWSEELLDSGVPHTQVDWVNLTLQPAYLQQGLRLAPGPLYHASIADVLQYATTATGEQKKLADKLVGLFKKDFDLKNPKYMMTGSRSAYMPAGQTDKVTHNYGYPDAVEETLDLVGVSGVEINASSHLENEIEALLGTRNLARVSQVYETLTGKKSRLWRLSSKPKSTDERALVLGCNYGDYFYVYAVNVIISSRPARGLVAVRAQSGVSQ